MSVRSPLLPDAVATAWVRQVRRQSDFAFDLKNIRLFDRAARPIEAELAAELAPSERLVNGMVRLFVPIGRGFTDDTIKPGQVTWVVDFNPKNGDWTSPGAAPWERGIAGLAAHVWRVRGQSDGGPIDARWDLSASLASAFLIALAAGDIGALS
jgi:hypothetical protein